MIEVVSPGTLTTVQDWPGRIGFWEVGVPPSGPMDARSLRIGNLLLGNPEGAPGLEITLTGPRLRFLTEASVALTGAPVAAKLDGEPVPSWEPFDVPAGGVLAVGGIRGAGMRSYLAVRGGIVGEEVMGSASAFAAARLAGGPLLRGGTLDTGSVTPGRAAREGRPEGLIPEFGNDTTLRLVPGPHGAPDFLTDRGLAELFRAPWKVHHQSDRTGVRLVGPTPDWARPDGGVAGLHPSNILDSAYCVGTVMLAGDMAVVVGPDGPSLGGFAAIGQVIRCDLWRLGQLRAGDAVRLEAVEPKEASLLHASAEAEIAVLTGSGGNPPPLTPPPARARTIASAVLDRPSEGAHGAITYRRAGEGAILAEFGAPLLDLRSRVRVRTLQTLLRAEGLSGIREITPGVRSLHVQFEPERIGTGRLLDALTSLEAAADPPEQATIDARTVHLPLAWRHSQAMLAVERYQASVRPDAPWCPDNIEFIRRINGLADENAVQAVVTAARYLVLGLGDVYMGAPVAVPLDPRHRLVTTKYTPARTWTPANAVGIGGTFLCVYGIEGPGGYQLVGRTVPIWYADDDPPWLLNHFDELRFELVSEEHLEALREQAEHGEWRPRVEPVTFALGPHERFLSDHAAEIERFTLHREAAFDAERRAWLATAGAGGGDEVAA